MPEINPSALSDAALAASTSGAVVSSRGPGQVPLADANLSWDSVAKQLGLATGKIAIDATASPDGHTCHSWQADPATPPCVFNIFARLNADNTRNQVISLVCNADEAGNPVDPTKHTARIVGMEFDWLNTSTVPAARQIEFHFGTYRFATDPAGTDRRSFTAVVNQSTQEASAQMMLDGLSVTDLAGNPSLNHFGDGTTLTFTLSAGHGASTAFSVNNTGTTTDVRLGRTGDLTRLVVNGATPTYQLQRNGLTKGQWTINTGNAIQLNNAFLALMSWEENGGASFSAQYVPICLGTIFEGSPLAWLHLQPQDTTLPGVMIQKSSGSAQDLLRIVDANGTTVFGRVNKDGYQVIKKNAAPADADLAAGELAQWFDSTNGAAKVKWKGKTANGTVVVGEVALA